MILPALALLAAVQTSSSDTGIAIIPRPVSIVRAAGQFRLADATVISVTSATRDVGDQLVRALAPATGYHFVVLAGAPRDVAGPQIFLSIDTSLAAHGPEAYRLIVAPGLVTITGASPAGVFYGVQSFRQLLPPQIFRRAKVDGVVWSAPALTIDDWPRFPWRGMELDVVRHFMPKEFVLKFIDLLALHKMNRFHWHLTDDQGWRIEIKKYPRLTSVGGWRAQTLIGPEPDDTAQAKYDGVRHGGFYTQDDIREVVAYAAARFITVIPEIEMPGHSQAAVFAYPQLGNTHDSIKVKEDWGVSAYILNPSDSTIHFMEDVLTEVMGLFPGKWIHTGGDEAVKTQWQASPLAQARIKALGLKNEDALQGWFTAQIDSFLAAHGRTLIGWDEILEGGLSPNAVVMSWRGVDGGIAAAQAGHDVVMAPGKYTYFDHYQSADREHEPLAIGGFLPLDSAYAYDPVPAVLTPVQARHILGAQGQLWSEYFPNTKQVEYMAFPRLAALAEAVWTAPAQKSYADFLGRMPAELARLDVLDVAYRPLNPPGDAVSPSPARVGPKGRPRGR